MCVFEKKKKTLYRTLKKRTDLRTLARKSVDDWTVGVFSFKLQKKHENVKRLVYVSARVFIRKIRF